MPGLAIESIQELTSLRYRHRENSWRKDSKSTRGVPGAVVTLLPALQHWAFSSQKSLPALSPPNLCLSVPPTVCAGGEAPRAGETGVPQHTQEAHGVSAGSAGSRGGQALSKYPLQSAGSLESDLTPRTPTPGQFLAEATQASASQPSVYFCCDGLFCSLALA